VDIFFARVMMMMAMMMMVVKPVENLWKTQEITGVEKKHCIYFKYVLP